MQENPIQQNSQQQRYIPNQPISQAIPQQTIQQSFQQMPGIHPNVQQKYCVNCGTILSADLAGKLYCPKCGFKLAQHDDGKERRAAIMKIVLYIAGGALAIFAVWFFFTKFQEMMNLF